MDIRLINLDAAADGELDGGPMPANLSLSLSLPRVEVLRTTPAMAAVVPARPEGVVVAALAKDL